MQVQNGSRLIIALVLLLFVWCPAPVGAQVLSQDAQWEGKVVLEEDLLILPGVTLTVAAGTEVTVKPAENTKIDPEFLSHQTEILVRGRLLVLGTEAQPVLFHGATPSPEAAAAPVGKPKEEESWAGITVDHGSARLEHGTIQQAENGLYVVDGKVDLLAVTFNQNRYAVVAQGGESLLTVRNSVVKENDYGLCSFNGAVIQEQDNLVNANKNNDRFTQKAAYWKVSPAVYQSEGKGLVKVYTNEALVGNTIWSGKIRVEGQLRIAPEGRLVILPGTVVEFTKKDTNGDGIGENGILVQGQLLAKGSKEEPITFRSAEPNPAPGDWDSINILASDQVRNLVEFCQIEHGYRGLHFHFSNVGVTNTVLRQNMRGIQFQESLVEIRGCQFYRNISAIQARDSEVVFVDNALFSNQNGANFYRLNLQARGNLFANNRWDGLRIREGTSRVEGNTMVGNRYGLLVADAVFGTYTRNLLAGNLEMGLVLKNSDNLEISGNAIEANGLNGIAVRESRAQITGNLIAGNGERGIGVISFAGTISGNNILDNGRYGIGLDGADEVDATGNWWANSDLDKEIYDHHDEARLGRVNYEAKSATPFLFTWPVAHLATDVTWSGSVLLPERITLAQGATLRIKPATTVVFAAGIGMEISGSLRADGLPEARITFTSQKKSGPGDWGEIALDRAQDSTLVNCNFEYATWGVHCHYTDLKVDRCLFEHNEGGLRFNSGPLLVTGSIFRNNGIGSRSLRGEGVFEGNEFAHNEIGMFIREMGSGLVFRRNNFIDNERYSVRMGDFNNEDVDARHNWWGGKPAGETVFDGTRESEIGHVLYEPTLTAPVAVELGGKS